MSDNPEFETNYRGFTVVITSAPQPWRHRWTAGWCDCGGKNDGLSPPGGSTPGEAMDLAICDIDALCDSEATQVMNEAVAP